MIIVVLWVLIPFLMCVALTAAVRSWAVRNRLLDIPNARSSHLMPTPRGGGVAIVAVVTLASVALATQGDATALLSITVAGLAVAGVGLLDDRRGLSARFRFSAHALAAGVLLAGTASLGPLNVPGLGNWPVAQWAFAWLAIVWLVNLFNFMDGIDGIAGMEGAFASAGLAACLLIRPGDTDRSTLACLAMAGACLGFLKWNWPPARIFMGDAGSGYLGFMLGALAVWCHRESGISLWVPTILLATFVCDATVTLVRRVACGQRWYEAHRSHAYQWLSRRFGRHLPVTLGVLIVNMVWLLPLALAAASRPASGGALAAIAYAPLTALAVWAGAGKAENDAIST